MPDGIPATPIIETVTWQRPPGDQGAGLPPMPLMLGRGLRCRCPNCGGARLFSGYLTVVATCPACAAPLGLARADDAPPYFTILIVGHVVLGGMLMLERAASPPMWVQAAIWLPMTVALTLGLLRPIKGATVGLMFRLGMLRSDTDA
jgi:uncharacterized protein (DUF983 family)